jgi:GNAT superfamily N-acetyltransferase
MARYEIRPLSADLLDDASRLLAARHRTHRRREAALDETFEDAAVVQAAIASLLGRDGATGFAASQGGALLGYLVLNARDHDKWGPNAWVEGAGHAATASEVIRELYAAAIGSWVENGHTNHYVIVPAGDAELLDAWFSLGFGRQHVHAIRSSPGPDFHPQIGKGLTIRRAVAADNPVLAELDLVVPTHSAGAPVFALAAVPTLEAALAELEDEAFVDDPRYATFVAEHDGRVIGEAVGCSIDESPEHAGLVRPPGAGFIGYAAVLPDARGLGAGRALGESVLAWARDAGYRTVVADWRSTNLEANRTWVGLGFQPIFHRLHRAIVT